MQKQEGKTAYFPIHGKDKQEKLTHCADSE
jgi:hypothetical protein